MNSYEEIEVLSAAEQRALLARMLRASAHRRERYPLSFAQQRLWFLRQLDPGDLSYNAPVAARLSGDLDAEVLGRALNEVVRRHTVLRTVIRAEGEEVTQTVLPSLTVELPLTDMRAAPPEERGAAAVELLLAERLREPFDLAAGPLLRASLLRLAETEYVVLLVMHHIITDGWSIGVLLREVATLYEAFMAGRPSPLPDLPLQYGDFARRQRDWLRGESLARQLAYWRPQLEGAQTGLELPLDRPRPAVQTHRGAKHQTRFTGALTRALKSLSRSEGVTLFMTLLAGFKALLWRYTGQDDVVVGTAVAGRNRAETEEIIGFFVNQLVLRTDVSGEPSFAELLGRVRQVATEAYAHQDVPFDKLVEALLPARDLSRHPLFQIAFTLQNAPLPPLKLADCTLTPLDIDTGTAKFDASFSLWESPDGLVLSIEYNADLFEAATIERLAAHYERLLAGACNSPHERLGRLPLLGEGERAQLLTGWNRTGAEYPRGACLHELFEGRARLTPEAVAVADGSGESLTYAELDERADLIARHLRQGGVGPEVFVGVLMRRSAGMVAALLGVLKAGGAYLPLDPEYPEARLAFMLEDSGARLLITEEPGAWRANAQGVRMLCVDGAGRVASDAVRVDEGAPSQARPDPENPAYVIYTSGSTGQPKGVQVTHSALTNFMSSMARYPGIDSRDTLLAVTSLSFDIAALELFLPLLCGARLFVADREVSADPTRLSALMEECGVTLMQATPATWRMLKDGGWAGRAGLKVLCGGEALPGDLADYLLGCCRELWNMFGPTETTIWSTVQEVRAQAPISIGRPIANTDTYILDARMCPVPVGVPGELYIGGAGLARGYLRRPAFTAERFVPHPFSEVQGARLYRTGDLARYREDGEIEFLGRLDQQVKVRGHRIELGEVEAALSRHEAVRACVAVAHTQGGVETRLAAYVVARPGRAVGAAELSEYLRAHLPGYMVPSAFVTLDELPLTPNGKIDRKALPAPAPDACAAGTQPRSPVEQAVAEIWAGVLGRERVGVHEDFFLLGGHSLLAARVLARARAVFGVELPLRGLFESPTVAGMAARVEAALEAGGGECLPPLLPAARDGSTLPLSFGQQRLWFLHQLEPGSAAYNIPAAIRLGGPLDVAALRSSLTEVVRRHEALRTTFSSDGGETAQTIREPRPVELPLLDLSELPPELRERRWRELAMEEAGIAFDLSGGTLLRARLLRLADDEHVALLTMHHIASDAWSMGVLARELGALYSAYSRGEVSPLEDPPVQYADYAAWQRGWLQGEVSERQLSYWKEKLDGAPPVLELPTDRPRSAAQTGAGAVRYIELPRELSDALTTLSRREGATLFMTLLAAFKTLLHRYTQVERVVVGTDIANRTRAELEGLIGFFANTLVLHTDLSGDPTFRELLARVRETALGAYAHQDVPFEKLVEELKPDRDLTRNPLFQVMFALQNVPLEPPRLAGLEVSALEPTQTTAKFDLTLVMTETARGLTGALEYSSELFDGETVERMLGHFGTLLRAVAGDPGRRLSELPLLSDEERHRLLIEWNDTARAYPRDVCFTQVFEAQAARMPEVTAVVCGARRVSYRELNAAANRLARALVREGVGPDMTVALLAGRGVELLAAILGVFKAGGTYLPLDSRHPHGRTLQMLRQSGTAVMLAAREFAPALAQALEVEGGGARPKVFELEEMLARDEAEDDPASSAAPRNLAYVIYTSGSTGAPKGAMVEHRGMLNHLYAKVDELGLAAGDIVAQNASQCFDISVWQMLSPLVVGGSVLFVSDETARDPELLLGEVERGGVTVLEIVPSLLRAMLDGGAQAAHDLPALRWLLLTGEALPPELCRRWLAARPCIPLVNAYGPTECSDDVTHYVVVEPPAPHVVNMPVGQPIVNTQVYVLDRGLRPLPVGVAGELCVGGDGVGRGYLNDPRRTAEVFAPDPYSPEPGARLYRTGDLARRLADGRVEFVGRLDQQVKVRGHRIELGEIEEALRRNKSVTDCVVTARENAAGSKDLVAYVVKGAPDEPAGGLDAHNVTQWGGIFDEVYGEGDYSKRDPSVNLRVWVSSYTGRPLPEDEIFECIDGTVERLLALRPRRVLEIGCGTGLMLFRVAPHCESYCGTDLSGAALRTIERRIKEEGRALPPVRLFNCAADELDAVAGERFDTVIINEVVQYFPSADYLVRVLEGALGVVAPGGRIFVGGVRSFPLFEAFHTSVQLHQAPDTLPLAELRRRVRKRMAQEKELLVDPMLFEALGRREGRVSHVEVQLRRARLLNELNRFRYDVTLHVGQAARAAGAPEWLDWRGSALTPSELRRALERPEVLCVGGVPNARTADALAAVELLAGGNGIETAGELREAVASSVSRREAFDPDEFRALAEEFSSRVEIGWSDADGGGRFDAVFTRRESARVAKAGRGREPAWGGYANNPARAAGGGTARELRAYLKERLPEYMLPSAFVVLDTLPLTANGKVDRKALLTPEWERAGAEYVAPRTEVEETLAAIWSELLGVERVGINDNFFDLGGHSMTALRFISLVKARLGAALPLSTLFEAPTVEGLARLLERPGACAPPGVLVKLQAGDGAAPFFCIHPSGGTVMCYVELARLLGHDQTFYAIQAAGLQPGEAVEQNLEAMAAAYVEALRSEQPAGPYRLGGFSAGGVVAFEMARQLEGAGQEVRLVALLDSYLPTPAAALAAEAYDGDRDVLEYVGHLGGLSGEELDLSYEEMRRLGPHERLRFALDLARRCGALPDSGGLEQLQRLVAVFQANVKALMAYTPRRYRGRVALFRATGNRVDARLTNDWEPFAAGGVEAYAVPCEHYTLLRGPHVGQWAPRLRELIERTRG